MAFLLNRAQHKPYTCRSGSDDLTGFERLDGSIDLYVARIVRIDFKQHGVIYFSSTSSRCG